jgi:hypothetical protein
LSPDYRLGPTVRRLPVHHPLVVVVLVLAFAVAGKLLLNVYDRTSLRLDPHVAFGWLGASFLVAFAAANLTRLRNVVSVALLATAVSFLVVDLVRHGNLLLQNLGPRNDLLSYLLIGFGSSSCAVAAVSAACGFTLFVVQHHSHLLLLLAMLYVSLLVTQIVLLRKNSALPEEPSTEARIQGEA